MTYYVQNNKPSVYFRAVISFGRGGGIGKIFNIYIELEHTDMKINLYTSIELVKIHKKF